VPQLGLDGRVHFLPLLNSFGSGSPGKKQLACHVWRQAKILIYIDKISTAQVTRQLRPDCRAAGFTLPPNGFAAVLTGC
jgi:hypothetical protein